MNRQYNIFYYRDGLAVSTICENNYDLITRLIDLLNDISVKDIRVSENVGLDSSFDSKEY